MGVLEKIRTIPLQDLRAVEICERAGCNPEFHAGLVAVLPHCKCDHQRGICFVEKRYQ